MDGVLVGYDENRDLSAAAVVRCSAEASSESELGGQK